MLGNKGTIKQAGTKQNKQYSITSYRIMFVPFYAFMNHTLSEKRAENNNKGGSERDLIVALAWIWVETSDWFGTPISIPAGPVCTLVAVGPAGTAVAAESHGVGEDRIGVSGTAGQYGCAVFHLVISAASLDKKAQAEYLRHVAVLLTIRNKTHE